ncbi:MAG TPA: HAD family hydrolase, partial [Geobacter sp.]|nr:HAD family hydrolase [Geobacter sp.]
ASMDYRKLFPLMVMEEGLRETLEALRGRVELAVCTNRASSMESLLESFGLEGFFSCVMTAGRVRNPKPHPEPLLKVLEHYGIAPGEALFVGDSDVDRQAAQGAGVPFVAYRGDMPAMARIERHQDLLLLL